MGDEVVEVTMHRLDGSPYTVRLIGEAARRYRLNFEHEDGSPRTGIALDSGQSLSIEWAPDGKTIVEIKDTPR
jgi:hypothetical protein